MTMVAFITLLLLDEWSDMRWNDTQKKKKPKGPNTRVCYLVCVACYPPPTYYIYMKVDESAFVDSLTEHISPPNDNIFNIV